MKFSAETGMGLRLEVARLLMREKGDKKSITWSDWCQQLHMPLSQYAEVTENIKPVPMVVWLALYKLGFDLNWFASGEGEPFRTGEKENKIEIQPVRMPRERKDSITRKAMEQTSFLLGNSSSSMKNMVAENEIIKRNPIENHNPPAEGDENITLPFESVKFENPDPVKSVKKQMNSVVEKAAGSTKKSL